MGWKAVEKVFTKSLDRRSRNIQSRVQPWKNRIDNCSLSMCFLQDVEKLIAITHPVDAALEDFKLTRHLCRVCPLDCHDLALCFVEPMKLSSENVKFSFIFLTNLSHSVCIEFKWSMVSLMGAQFFCDFFASTKNSFWKEFRSEFKYQACASYDTGNCK